MKAVRILRAGLVARIVHARTGFQSLGWAIELRDRSLGRSRSQPVIVEPRAVLRSAMHELALSFRRDLAIVHNILEVERETVWPHWRRLPRLGSQL